MKTTNVRLMTFKEEIKKYISDHHFWQDENKPIEANIGPAFKYRSNLVMSREIKQEAQEESVDCFANVHNIEVETTPFSEILFHLIDGRKMDDVSLYKKAQMDRKLFSKIRSDPLYNPSKETVFRLLLALELNIIEAKELLEAAGYSFGKTSKLDYIVRYCVEHRVYDIATVNEIIFENLQKTI